MLKKISQYLSYNSHLCYKENIVPFFSKTASVALFSFRNSCSLTSFDQVLHWMHSQLDPLFTLFHLASCRNCLQSCAQAWTSTEPCHKVHNRGIELSLHFLEFEKDSWQRCKLNGNWNHKVTKLSKMDNYLGKYCSNWTFK